MSRSSVYPMNAGAKYRLRQSFSGPGMALDEKELEAYCRDQMAGYKIPRKIMVTDSLPRVHGWKLLRRELREKFGDSPR